MDYGWRRPILYLVRHCETPEEAEAMSNFFSYETVGPVLSQEACVETAQHILSYSKRTDLNLFTDHQRAIQDVISAVDEDAPGVLVSSIESYENIPILPGGILALYRDEAGTITAEKRLE